MKFTPERFFISKLGEEFNDLRRWKVFYVAESEVATLPFFIPIHPTFSQWRANLMYQYIVRKTMLQWVQHCKLCHDLNQFAISEWCYLQQGVIVVGLYFWHAWSLQPGVPIDSVQIIIFFEVVQEQFLEVPWINWLILEMLEIFLQEGFKHRCDDQICVKIVNYKNFL